MTRYKLPDVLGGGEHEATVNSGSQGRVVFHFDGGAVLWIPPDQLVALPDPVPAEPEPGAYLIGTTPFIRQSGEHAREWLGAGFHVRTWAEVWFAAGGPDVTITKLVPAMPEVELPWGVHEVTVMFAPMALNERYVKVLIPNEWDFLTAKDAEAMAAALMTAARAARSKP